MSIKNVLWVVPKYTFPASDGARVASNSLVQSFNTTEHKLDVLSLVDNNESDTSEYKEKWNANNVYLISRAAPKSKLQKLIYWARQFLLHPLSPLTLSYFRDKSVVGTIQANIKLDRYEVIIFDGLHGHASLEKLLVGYNGKIIYRAHNVEQDLWITAADKSKNYLVSLFYKYQGRLMAKFENNLIEKSHITWTICNEDQERFQNEVPNGKFITVPVGMNFSTFTKKETSDAPLQLFFLGRLDWAPNREGLRWFLDEVWPTLSLKRKDIFLNIGGSGNGDWIKPYLGKERLNFLGLIDDLDATYKMMDMAIMPIFFGSGTRIKVIESACYGLPMISTKMGVQGSELSSDHYFHAETSSEWISILSTMSREGLGQKSHMAWTHLQTILDYQAITKIIEETL